MSTKLNSIIAPQKGEETAADEIRRITGEYRQNGTRQYEIEDILRQKYDLDPPKIPRTAKTKPGLITDEIVVKIRAYFADKPKGVNNTAFTRELGLYGISGLQEVNSARAELVDSKVIVVDDLGVSKGRGSAKLIKLAEPNS